MSLYHVRLAAYCGMTVPYGEVDELADARNRVAQRIRYVRRNYGCPVAKLGKHEWEVQEPEDCFMVPDFCGVLRIAEIPTEHECNGCNAMIPLKQRYCEDCQ